MNHNEYVKELDKYVEDQIPEDGKFHIIHEDAYPDLLICTPLWNQEPHKEIEQTTLDSVLIKNSDVKVAWFAYESHFNCAGNKNFAFNFAKSYFDGKRLPRYLLFCNRDIQWFPRVIRRMMQTLKKASMTVPEIGYCYGGFQRYGDLNCTIHSRDWDPASLLYSNYIDNNCIFDTEIFDQNIRFDTSLNNYDDYNLFLSLFLYRYIIGTCYSKELIFKTETLETDISYGPRWFHESTYRMRKLHLNKIKQLTGRDDPNYINGYMEKQLLARDPDHKKKWG